MSGPLSQGQSCRCLTEHLHKEIIANYYHQVRYPVLFTGMRSISLVEEVEEDFIKIIVKDYRRIAHNKTVDVVRELEGILAVIYSSLYVWA